MNVLEDWSKLNIEDQKTKQEFDDMMGDYDLMIEEAGYDLPAKLLELIPYFGFFGDYGTILDLCCGTGKVGESLCNSKRHITGIDFSNNIKIAHEKGVYDSLIQQDVNNLPCFITKFDYVFMIGSLTYFNPQKIFEEICQKIQFEKFYFSHRVDLIDNEFMKSLEMFSVVKQLDNISYLPKSDFYKDKPINLYMVKK